MRELKYFYFRGERIVIEKALDGRWLDAWGCEYALRDDRVSFDNKDRAGIWPFVLPIPLNHPVNEAARPHDYKYSSPTYQAYYLRSQADADLERDERLMNEGSAWRIVAKPFRFIARWLGRFAWENKKTND